MIFVCDIRKKVRKIERKEKEKRRYVNIAFTYAVAIYIATPSREKEEEDVDIILPSFFSILQRAYDERMRKEKKRKEEERKKERTGTPRLRHVGVSEKDEKTEKRTETENKNRLASNLSHEIRKYLPKPPFFCARERELGHENSKERFETFCMREK